MNVEYELQLQAYLDGELAERDARPVSDRLARDPEAQRLLAELTATKSWLAGNEPEVTVPESREFYWSKIEREIDRLESAVERQASRPGWLTWLKYLAPAAGVALAIGLAVVVLKPAAPTTPEDPLAYLAETENLSEYTTSFAFRSQRENMFVVWISNKEPQPRPASEPSSEVDNDVLYQ